MISLAKHIELLLLQHDCVIMPSVGGFIAKHTEATYTGEGENVYLPPTRTVGFNENLKVNDGLLVQSYMAAYDASYPAAQLQMEQDIDKMMMKLEREGMYELENVGVLHMAMNQSITFTTAESGVTTPALYGLYAVDIASLQETLKTKEIAAALHQMENQTALGAVTEKNGGDEAERKNDVVIRIKRRWLEFGISVAAAIVMFFGFTYPTIQGVSSESDTVVATMAPFGQKPTAHVVKKNVEVTKEVEVTAKNAETKPVAQLTEKATNTEKEQPESPMEEVKEDTKGKKFSIVLASYVTRKNAEAFIATLAKQGLNEATYVNNGKVSRVLYSTYSTEEECRKALSELREKNSNFAEAWLLELKD